MYIGNAPWTTVLNQFSLMRINVEIAFISIWKDFCLIPLGKMCFLEESYKGMQKNQVIYMWHIISTCGVHVVIYMWNQCDIHEVTHHLNIPLFRQLFCLIASVTPRCIQNCTRRRRYWWFPKRHPLLQSIIKYTLVLPSRWGTQIQPPNA